MGLRTRPWRYISGKNLELKFIEISGVVVEPRRRYHNCWIFPEGVTCMTSTTCSEAFLAPYLHAKSFSVSRALADHVTAPLSYSRAARSRRKSQLGYFLFGSAARLPGIQNGRKQLGMERTTTNCLVLFEPFQPGRNKLRHALSKFCV